MLSITRRGVLTGAWASALCFLSRDGLTAAETPQFRLLRPERLAHYPDRCPLNVAVLDGKINVGYVLQRGQSATPRAPLILYFHGTGGGFRPALPPEYPLLDDGFDILMPLRPSYTDQGAPCGKVAGATCSGQDGCDAKFTARIAAKVLDQVRGNGKWEVAVIGMSGGGPSALAFASLFPMQTKALVLQAAVTRPWWHVKYVPASFARDYQDAVNEHKDLPNDAERYQAVTMSLGERIIETAKAPGYNIVESVVGKKRLRAVQRDIAGDAVITLELKTPYNQDEGTASDFFRLFRASREFCDWRCIIAPTLIIHDEEDIFVRVAHARMARHFIRNAQLKAFRLGGHMVWLGDEAAAMHQARVAFLRRHLRVL